jgi:hypothetical protein
LVANLRQLSPEMQCCGSGSDFGKVLAPVPVPFPFPFPDPDHILQFKKNVQNVAFSI